MVITRQSIPPEMVRYICEFIPPAHRVTRDVLRQILFKRYDVYLKLMIRMCHDFSENWEELADPHVDGLMNPHHIAFGFKCRQPTTPLEKPDILYIKGVTGRLYPDQDTLVSSPSLNFPSSPQCQMLVCFPVSVSAIRNTSYEHYSQKVWNECLDVFMSFDFQTHDPFGFHKSNSLYWIRSWTS